MKPGAESVAAEAATLQAEANARGLTLSLIGSLAIMLRCPTHAPLMAPLGRRVPQDIDFVGYQRESRQVEIFFESRGYVLHPSVSHSREFGLKRLIYADAAGHKVDVFLDALVMAHTIDFAGRLRREEPTVSLADLLLSKLQIHRITHNDLVDLTLLLAEHDLGQEPGQIDLDYVVGILSADWGFHYSAISNVAKLDELVEQSTVLPPPIAARVVASSNQLRDAVDRAPKTTRWRIRARVGTRLPWYEHVDEVDL